MKHTKEPWDAISGYVWQSARECQTSQAIADFRVTNKNHETAEHDAERAVQCVNACAGIDDPVETLLAYRRLRAAAESWVLNPRGISNPKSPNQWDFDDWSNEYGAYIERLRSALSALDGGE